MLAQIIYITEDCLECSHDEHKVYLLYTFLQGSYEHSPCPTIFHGPVKYVEKC